MNKISFEEIMKTKTDKTKNSIDVTEDVMNRIETYEQQKSRFRHYFFIGISIFTLVTSLLTIFFLEGASHQYQWLALRMQTDFGFLKILSQGFFAVIFLLTIALLSTKFPLKKSGTIACI